MQATGLRTDQPAFNRGFLGALLAVGVAAALAGLLGVGTINRTSVGPAIAPAVGLDGATRAEIEFRALEPAAYAAMLTEAERQAFIEFRAEERAGLTPAQEAAAQREAVRKFHMMERAERAAEEPALGYPATRGK